MFPLEVIHEPEREPAIDGDQGSPDPMAADQGSWTDVKSLEFERKYLEELETGVNMAVTIVEQLETLLTKIRKDCE